MPLGPSLGRDHGTLTIELRDRKVEARTHTFEQHSGSPLSTPPTVLGSLVTPVHLVYLEHSGAQVNPKCRAGLLLEVFGDSVHTLPC